MNLNTIVAVSLVANCIQAGQAFEAIDLLKTGSFQDHPLSSGFKPAKNEVTATIGIQFGGLSGTGAIDIIVASTSSVEPTVTTFEATSSLKDDCHHLRRQTDSLGKTCPWLSIPTQPEATRSETHQSSLWSIPLMSDPRATWVSPYFPNRTSIGTTSPSTSSVPDGFGDGTVFTGPGVSYRSKAQIWLTMLAVAVLQIALQLFI